MSKEVYGSAVEFVRRAVSSDGEVDDFTTHHMKEVLRQRLERVRALGGVFRQIEAGSALVSDRSPAVACPIRGGVQTNRVGSAPVRQG